MTERTPNRAVYTALIGSYERLVEQPVAKTTNVPFICLTDDPTLTSDTWDVHVLDPALPLDPARSSRFPKILGELPGAHRDETLWIDNRVVLTQDPDVILDELLDDADVAVLHHSSRESVIAEFDEVARLGLDDPARVYEQLIHYAETRPHILDLRPYWGGFIARRWTPAVETAMRTWMDHVLRYSRRDQLSFRYALDGVPRVRALDLDNLESSWHTWLTDTAIDRNTAMRSDAFRTSIRAPLASVASLTAEVDSLRAQLRAANERSDLLTAETVALREEAVELGDQVAGLRDQVSTLGARVAQLRDQTQRLRSRVARLRRRVGRLQAKLVAERDRSAALEARLARTPAGRARRAVRAVRRRASGSGPR